MNAADQFASAAEAYIGVPFRLYGREPTTGLDCVGLVAASLSAIGRRVTAPHGYRLRNSSLSSWLGIAELCDLRQVDGDAIRGDVLLTAPGPAQNHLLIVSDPSHVVHAHAGLRRVVRQPIAKPLSPEAHWRLASS